MIATFRGYNHNRQIQLNEFFEMRNMTGDVYPVLSPRQRRAYVRGFGAPGALFAHEKLAWVDGTGFYYDGVRKGTVTAGEKQLVGMGAYICIFPDGIVYSTQDNSFVKMAAKVITSGTVSVMLSKADGTEYANYTASDLPPATPTNGQLWVDTSADLHLLKQYSEALGMWKTIPTTYIKIIATGIGKNFAQYDGVELSGLTNDALNTANVVQSASDNFIVVQGILDQVFTQTKAVTVERKIPQMDFVCELNNRLWGCSSANHEVYACKHGDPKNWYCFEGLATDSYVATIGSRGDFTGATSHNGYVFFFKEDIIHQVYGNRPANFQITDTVGRGVQKGCHKSLAVVNETLYYKARGGVCSLRTAMPYSISDALGEKVYTDAVGGGHDSKYYISMKDEAGNWSLFVYNEDLGLWHREDETHALFMARLGGDFYIVDAKDNRMMNTVGVVTEYADSAARMEQAVEWSATTGAIGMDHPDKKYIERLVLRAEVDAKALLRVEAMFNESGTWEEVGKVNMQRKDSAIIPVIPRRCDTMRLRISGKGVVRLYSISKFTERGGYS